MKCSLCKFKVRLWAHQEVREHFAKEHAQYLRGHGLKGVWRDAR